MLWRYLVGFPAGVLGTSVAFVRSADMLPSELGLDGHTVDSFSRPPLPLSRHDQLTASSC